MSKLNLKNVTLIGIEGRRSHIDFLLFTRDICAHYCDFYDVKILTPLDYRDRDVIRVSKLGTLEEYNFFVIKELHKYCESSHALIINWDSFVLEPNNWMDEFLEYDYIGATWGYKSNKGSEGGLASFDTGNVGNGGFSLRSKKLMELTSKYLNFRQPNRLKKYYETSMYKIINEKFPISKSDFKKVYLPGVRADDHHICRYNGAFLKGKGIKFAPNSIANKFSVEGNISHNHIWKGTSFGFHSYETIITEWKDRSFFNKDLMLDKAYELYNNRLHTSELFHPSKSKPKRKLTLKKIEKKQSNKLRGKKLKLDNVTLIGIEGNKDSLTKFKKVADICRHYCDFGKVKLLSSFNIKDKDYVKIKEINSQEAYQKFCIAELNNYFDTEFALIFQSDGFILNPDMWMDEFLEYDYIGAPWGYQDNEGSNEGLAKTDPGNVGNGGFSLRSKKLMNLVTKFLDHKEENNIDCTSAHKVISEGLKYEKYYVHGIRPEDHHICRFNGSFLKSKGIKFAPENIAEKFSRETTDKWIWDQSTFGFHGVHTNLKRWEDKKHFNYE